MLSTFNHTKTPGKTPKTTSCNIYGNKYTVNGASSESEELTWQPQNYRLTVAARVKAKENELNAIRLAP